MTPVDIASRQSSPIFIIGCPRSGTSALSWALAQHPGLWVSAESDFIQLLFGYGHMQRAYRLAHGRPDQGWLAKNDVDYAEFCAHLGTGVDQLFLSRSDGKRWIDSSPGYTLFATELALMLPNARFVHLVRDGRAVVNSMINSNFDIDWARDFERACFTWGHYIDKGLDFEEIFPERTMRVSHSDLLANPEQCCDDVIGFLGEAQDPASAAFLRNGRINSSYDNTIPEDIRRKKNVDRLKESPWRSWTVEQHGIFARTAGGAMTRSGFQWPPQDDQPLATRLEPEVAM